MELEDNIDLNLSDAQSYIYVIKLTYIHWSKIDTINNLEFSVLSHLLHTLFIANNQSSSTNMFWYNIDLFERNTFNWLNFEVKTDIDDTIDII